MAEYTIIELLYYDCDKYGSLTASFRIEGDSEDTYRTIETDEYYYCAEKESSENDVYHTKEWEEGDLENDGFYYSHFDFSEWLEYEHSEEKVIEFIYDNYELEDLPEPEFE
jgi:hypothetical protein